MLAGVCVDLFAVTNEYTDLASLKYLSIDSGGGLLLYSSTEEATLPQDLYVRILFLFLSNAQRRECWLLSCGITYERGQSCQCFKFESDFEKRQRVP